MFNHIRIKNLIYLRTAAAVTAMLAASALLSKAGDISSSKDATATPDTRYGLFNLLDHRSAYGQGAFPEPFLVDDSDLEQNEFRVDWLHTRTGSVHSDMTRVEIEKGFGPVTFELEVPYERTRDDAAGTTTEGLSNIDVGVRTPVYQYVSKSGFIDNTFGVALEVGIPSNTKVSKNTEIVPKIFNDLKIGEHFTMQSVFGFAQLLGPGDDGGAQAFEYGFILGYGIPHKELPLPGVQRLIPMLELSGETQLNKDNPGHNSLLANAGVRVNLNSIGPVQPRLGVGFVFPLDQGARQDTHWGIYTSLVFEY